MVYIYIVLLCCNFDWPNAQSRQSAKPFIQSLELRLPRPLCGHMCPIALSIDYCDVKALMTTSSEVELSCCFRILNSSSRTWIHGYLFLFALK
jgi:hypothetical protein